MKEKRKPTNFRLTDTAVKILDKVCERDGTTKTAIVERIIRELGREQGILRGKVVVD